MVMAHGVADHIRRHGEEEYPHECCGFLFGTLIEGTQQIVEARRQSNARTESREIRFLISPEDFREAERYARKSGRQMLGIYHSHPDDAAHPSEYDRDHALVQLSHPLGAPKGRGGLERLAAQGRPVRVRPCGLRRKGRMSLISIEIPTALRAFAGNKDSVQLEGQTVGELPERVAELNSADQIVVHCRTGGRSAKAVEFLRTAGFRKVKNLVGGINAWADEVDTTLPKS